ncbi:MAG TPA: glycosyltransferase, partial [Acidimicrobiales bacterium]|nr:glycosyltransferase [Acidimicrobiales bacterium]
TTVYTELGHPTAADFATRPGARRLWRAAVRRASAVTALSRSAADAVTNLAGRVPHVLPPGCRLEQFPPDREPRTGPPVLLFPADASEPRKGLHLLLQALPALLATHPDLRLHLGGPGDPRPALDQLSPDAVDVRAAIDQLGVGQRNDLPGRYRTASVTVLPAWNEAFGLVLVESLASGTPVVCTATGGMSEIVDDEAVGRTFPRGDVGGLVGAVEAALELACAPGTATRCVEAARRFDWVGEIGPRHVALYDELRQRRRGS